MTGLVNVRPWVGNLITDLFLFLTVNADILLLNVVSKKVLILLTTMTKHFDPLFKSKMLDVLTQSVLIETMFPT